MSLARFEIVVTVDKDGGISRGDEIPWRGDVKSVSAFANTLTMGAGKNVVIIGRNTFVKLPDTRRGLPGRDCIVLSRTLRQENYPGLSICATFEDALVQAAGQSYDKVFVIGGKSLFDQATTKFLYLCNKIHLTKLKKDYQCDMSINLESLKKLPLGADPVISRDWNRATYAPKTVHDEYVYLNLLNEVMNNGDVKPNRTSTQALSVTGLSGKYDLRNGIPIITTKKMPIKAIIKELLFFVSGKTDTKILESQGVNIWKGNTSREFLDAQELDYEDGVMGPAYGYQWRHWGEKYTGEDVEDPKGIDQLKSVIDNIRDNPFSRRHVVSAWNVAQLDEMALAPCHFSYQFVVSADKQFLDCVVYQRSADMFLGVPFNITSYSLLLSMVAHLVHMKPRYLVHHIGDAHIYTTHKDAVARQLRRTPYPFPTLKFRRSQKLKTIDDFTLDSFVIEGYTSHDSIRAEMVV